MSEKIDIIIPYYNTEAHLLNRCLHSIAMQSIKDELTITIVDDASKEKYYEEVIPKFQEDIEIKVLRYEENKGPGYARQYGIDRTNNPLILFIDADDTFCSYISVAVLRNYMRPQDDICFGKIQEIGLRDGQYLLLDKDIINFTWMFAKLFRRSSIEKSGATFNEGVCSYANEDVGFNMQFLMGLGLQTLNYTYVEFPVYYWNALNFNTITRENNFEYTYNRGLEGYMDNYVATYYKIYQRIDKSSLTYYLCSCLINILKCFEEYSEVMKQNGCYTHLIKKIRDIYKEIVAPNNIKDVVFEQFLNSIETEEQKQNIIKWFNFIKK